MHNLSIKSNISFTCMHMYKMYNTGKHVNKKQNLNVSVIKFNIFVMISCSNLNNNNFNLTIANLNNYNFGIIIVYMTITLI